MFGPHFSSLRFQNTCQVSLSLVSGFDVLVATQASTANPSCLSRKSTNLNLSAGVSQDTASHSGKRSHILNQAQMTQLGVTSNTKDSFSGMRFSFPALKQMRCSNRTEQSSLEKRLPGLPKTFRKWTPCSQCTYPLAQCFDKWMAWDSITTTSAIRKSRKAPYPLPKPSLLHRTTSGRTIVSTSQLRSPAISGSATPPS